LGEETCRVADHRWHRRESKSTAASNSLSSGDMQEVRYDRGPNGHLKAWVCTAWDRIRLRKCADIVQNEFGGEARDRVGGADLVFWDFMVGTVLVTVHLEQHVGIAVLANDAAPTSEATVRDIAEHLFLRAALSE
jgi:hypothetical protein